MGGQSLPIDIQTLGPGTTQPIQKWVDQALAAGSGWVASAEAVATNAINAGNRFGSNLFGNLTNEFVRGFLIFFGVAIIIVSLIALMWNHGGQQVVTKTAKVMK